MPEIRVPLTNEALSTFREMQTKGCHNYLVFQMVGKNIEIVASGDNSATFDEFAKCFPTNECRYGVYKMHFAVPSSVDGLNEGMRTKNVFVYWAPDSANVKEKFMYSAAVMPLKQQLAASFIGIQVGNHMLSEEQVLKKCLEMTK
jgi:cofilin